MRRSADGPAADGRSGSNFSTNGGRLSLRAKGEKEDGFAITASRTVAVPLDRLYQAFVDESLRADWLPEGQLHERTTTRPRSARFDWGDSATRVNVTFLAKGEARSVVARAMNEHTRTPITDVRTVGVPVTDQARALEFYLDKLGLETRLDIPLRQLDGRCIDVARGYLRTHYFALPPPERPQRAKALRARGAPALCRRVTAPR